MLFKRKARDDEEFAELMDTPVVDGTEAGSAMSGSSDASAVEDGSATDANGETAKTDINPFEQEPVSDAFEMREADNGPHIPLWGWIVGGVIIVALLAGFVYAAFIMPAHDNTVKKEDSTTGQSLGTATENGSKGSDSIASAQKKLMDSLGLPDYYQSSAAAITDKDRKTADSEAIAGAPVNAEAALTSKAQNPELTDNPDEAMNKDGTINPNYSYLTYDNVVPVIRDDIERLVNPVYGNWSGLDIGDSTAWKGIKDMFSSKVQITDKDSARNASHLFADWDSDYYGGKYVTNTPFIGVPNTYDCTFAVQGNYEDHIDCTVNVTYTAGVLGSDNTYKNTPVNKTMIIHYKVNYDELATSSRRVLITSVEQN